MFMRLSLCFALIATAITQTTSPQAVPSSAIGTSDIFHSTLGEQGKTQEISTAELQQVLANKSAIVLDTRPAQEYAMSHIPGALNVAAKVGVPISQYVSDVAEIGRQVKSKDTALVLYCNGPFCRKSKRLADELLAAGYTNVRRYQLGIPVWRALGGATQIESSGASQVLSKDQTSVWIDVRPPGEFKTGSLSSAKNIPRDLVQVGKDVGELKKAKDDGRLPMYDHNTRIIVFGGNEDANRFVAEQIAHEAFHNVTYFAGDWRQLK